MRRGSRADMGLPAWAKLLAAFLLVLSAVLGLREYGALARAELTLYDWILRMRPATPVDARVLVVSETEADLQRFGHPLPDAVLARALRILLQEGAAVVGVDKYRDIPVPPGTEALDTLLGAEARIVWVMKFGAPGVTRVLPPAALRGSARVGFSDLLEDEGGVVRRGLLMLDDGRRHWNSLALAAAAAYLAPRGVRPSSDPGRTDAVRLGPARLLPLERDEGDYAELDAAGFQVLLDYRGMPGRFARVSLGDLLDGRLAPGSAKGRLVMLGASAHSLRDFFHTPFGAGDGDDRITGVEIHAHLASQVLRLALGESAPLVPLAGWPRSLGIAAFALLGLLAYRLRAGWALGYMAAGAAVALASGPLAMRYSVWLPPFAPTLAFVATAVLAVALRVSAERAERAMLMTLFARHVSDEVAQALWRGRATLLEGGRLRPLPMTATILFADAHGYTPLAQTLAPATLAGWLGEFMDAMSREVIRHHGVVWQFAGDAVMAAFGAPFPRRREPEIADDARNAVRCARGMVEALDRLGTGWKARGLPGVGLRVGVHTGPVVACSIGSARRLEYALVGDVVNVAARLQALEDDADAPRRILLSGATAALLPADPALQALGAVPLKGRSGSLQVFRVRL